MCQRSCVEQQPFELSLLFGSITLLLARQGELLIDQSVGERNQKGKKGKKEKEKENKNI